MNPGSFCGSCGAVVKPGALYCGSCGAATVNPSTATAVPVPPPAMVGTIGGDVPAPPAATVTRNAGFSHPVPSGAPVGPPAPGLLAAGPPGFTRYASFGRRVGAYLIDAVPYLIILAIGYSALLAAVLGRARVEASLSFSLIVLFVGPIVYFIVMWAMAAKGNSPGNALLGIRVVRESTGAEPGAGLGLGRLLLKGLLIGITFYIGGFSPLWDKTGRRQGWWDSACNTVVLDRDAVAEYRAAAAGAQPPSLAVMSSGGLPQYPPALPEPWPASASPAGETGWGQAPIGDDRPVWDRPPPPPPPPPPAATPSRPIASWDDRPVDAMPPPMTAAPTSVDARPAAAPPPTREPDPTADPDWPAPSSGGPAVIAAVPGFGSAPAAALIPEPESYDHTRMRVSPQTQTTGGWRADLDDGRRLVLSGPIILGRDPSAGPDERSAVTVPIADEGRSVSKTHLLLDVGPAGVQVVDRHSTNGVVVVTAGVDLRCVPGVPTPVPDGSTVRFGDRSLVVRRS